MRLSELRVHLTALVDYNYADEKEDFEEMEARGEDTSGHVFLHLLALSQFLDED